MRFVFAFFFVALLSAIHASAVSNTSTVSGSVTDSSGSAVPHATLRLHQIGGSGVLTAQSDTAGQYVFANVAPGEYLLDASAGSLELASAIAVRVGVGENREIPVRLSVSAMRTQVSVTAAAAPQSYDSISKDLDIVNTADVQQRGLVSLAQAIQFLPGIRVSTEGALGQFTEIQTRGLPPEDTAVLIDGFRFRDPTGVKGDATAYLGDLLLVDSSRIEVLQGSGSSLYGTNAVGGTINLITNAGGGPLHGDIDTQGGALGLFRGLAQIAGGVAGNRMTYSLGISRLNVSDGVNDAGAARDWSAQGGILFAITPRIRIGGDLLANKGYTQTSVIPQPTPAAPAGEILPAIPLSGSQLVLAEQNQSYNPGNATFLPALGDPDAGRYSHFANSLIRYEQELTSRLSYRVAYAIMDGNRNQTDGPAGPGFQEPFNSSDRFIGRIDTAQVRVSYWGGSHQILSGGYEFERENYLETARDQNPNLSQRTYTRTQARQQTGAAFAQDELHLLGGKRYVLLSGRYTKAGLFEPHFVGGSSPYATSPLPSPPSAYTGDASTAYFFHKSSTKLRAHVGNSFRLPSLYERFGGYFYGGYQPLGDPRLSPERTLSVDGGVDQYAFHERLRISATYFYARRQNIINYADVLPFNITDPYGRFSGYYNTVGGVARGLEFSSEFRPRRTTSVFASYTYTHAKDSISEYYPGPAPLAVPRVFEHAVSVVAMQQLAKRLDVAVDFRAGSSYLFPLFYGYAYQFHGPRELGISAGYSFRVTEGARARFYVRVSNAFDQKYYEDGFPTPGRCAQGGIHVSF